MKNWRYIGVLKTGKVHSGKLQAESKMQAMEILQKNGLDQIRELEEDVPVKDSVLKKILSNAPSANELYLFFTQLKAFQSAGEPLQVALKGMIPYIKNKTLRKVSEEMRTDLKGGTMVDVAFEKHSCFPRFCGPLLRAGIASGSVDKIFGEIALFLKRDNEVKREISLALVPIKIFAVLLAVAGLVITNLLAPRCQQIAADLGRPIPAFSQAVYNIINFGQDHWFLLLLLVVAEGLFLDFLIKKYPGKYHTVLYHLPVYKHLYRSTQMYRMTKVMELLIRGGVGPSESLEHTANALDNVIMRDIILKAKNKVQFNGEQVTKAISDSDPKKVIDFVMISLLNTGERTGSSGELLKVAGELYDEELKDNITRFKHKIGPLFLSPMALIILVLVVAIYYPMIDIIGGAI